MSEMALPDLERHQSRRPPLRLTAMEAVALISPSPRLSLSQLSADIPRGDGHTVLMLPALFRGDRYTATVRGCLTELGYHTHGWNLAINVGPTKRLLDGAADLLIKLADQHGPASIEGFSMGGLLARWLALQMRVRVRQIITVCGPIREPARNFWLPLEPMVGLWPGVDLHKLPSIGQHIPVPGTFLFSRNDGLVNGTDCFDASAGPENNIEITSPHVLIASNPQVMTIVAQRLAQSPGMCDRA
jgi:pimeloyl-ACP methyl ester carboxylesterase